MTYSLSIELPGLPAIISNARVHWSRRAQENQYWRRQVFFTTIDKRPTEPLYKASLTLTRYSPRRPDFDNLAISFKCVIDALIESYIIIDDTHEVIGVPTYLWEKSKLKHRRIGILVKGG